MTTAKTSGRPAPEDDCESESLGEDYLTPQLAVFETRRFTASVLVNGELLTIGFYKTSGEAEAAEREMRARGFK